MSRVSLAETWEPQPRDTPIVPGPLRLRLAMPFILMFTAVLVVITLSGSLWVMYHLNTNMMPSMSSQDMRVRP